MLMVDKMKQHCHQKKIQQQKNEMYEQQDRPTNRHKMVVDKKRSEWNVLAIMFSLKKKVGV